MSKKTTKVVLPDGIEAVDYKVRDYADGSGRIEVYYFKPDGFRCGIVDSKRPYTTVRVDKETGKETEIVKMETRKQLIKRLCDFLGIAY